MDNPLFRLLYPGLRPDDPCPHMRTLVSDLASDALNGAALMYTHSHVANCARCTRALAALRDVQARLHPLRTDTPRLEAARRAQVEAEWTRREQVPDGGA